MSEETRSLPFRSPESNPAFTPALFMEGLILRDALETGSSDLQDKTIEECLPFLNGSEFQGKTNQHQIPALDRQRHIRFLHKQLGELPPGFVAADSSRPWIFYWCLSALMLFGEDVSVYRERLMETARATQNPTGGFGGGFGQTSHLATTYATILALTLVGDVDVYSLIDRRSMWKWLCSVKRPDGGFQMAVGGEEDVRGAYCAAVIISLLQLPLELSTDSPAYAAGHRLLYDGLGDWIRRCQTYEGGVSAMPGVEAHGAYAFCALGCLSIMDSPHRSIPRYFDIPKLVSWLSARQYAPEGGFSGRTNKLVDGCYSHWVGGCWPLIEAALRGPPCAATDVESLYSRNALIRYILCCCQDQSKRGGLRDKPSKFSDAYHTCYVLSGLSSAQHEWIVSGPREAESPNMLDKWTAMPYLEGEQIFNEDDRVGTTNPVYVIPQHKLDEAVEYFQALIGAGMA